MWLAPLLKNAPAKSRLGAWVLIAFYLGFSIWGTYDALSFSKAKWDITLKAHDAGIEASQLVSGYEPDGFFNFTNENYGVQPEFIIRNGPWWLSKLNLGITPYYVVVEKGVDVTRSNSPWSSYQPTDIENDRMVVLAVPR